MVLCASALLAGCFAPVIPDLPRQTPEAWQVQSGSHGEAVALRSWWRTLQDPILDSLVDEALAGNLDLEQAALRLHGERLIAERWGTSFMPGLTGEARPVQDVSAQDMYFHASLDMVWELGLFGALENSRLKAMADLGYAQAGWQGLRVAVVASVVRNYLDLAQAQRQADLLDRLAGLDARERQLAQLRFEARLGSQAEVAQAALQQAQTRVLQAFVQERAERAARALALLLGREQPDPHWGAQAVARLPESFSIAQVPADLLRTRPDISQAQAEVLQVAAQLGLARSALYPRLRLGGSILYSYNITRNMRTSTDSVPSIGPMLDVPLWDWGARRARVKSSEKELEAALLGYRKAVLSGVSEVEACLASMGSQQHRVAALREAAATMQARQGRQRTLAGLGLSSALDGLQLERAALLNEIELSLASGARTLAFVALYKALGGAPLPTDPQGDAS